MVDLWTKSDSLIQRTCCNQVKTMVDSSTDAGQLMYPRWTAHLSTLVDFYVNPGRLK